MAVGFPAKTSFANGNALAASDLNDITGTLNLLSAFNTGSPQLQSPLELVTVTGTGAASSLNYDCATQAVWFSTASATANWTLNFRGSGSVALNTLLATGQAITVVHLATQGATAYYPTAFTVDGSSVTPKWQGGTAPTAGNASGIDAYSYTIIKTGSATFTVLASVVQFK